MRGAVVCCFLAPAVALVGPWTPNGAVCPSRSSALRALPAALFITFLVVPSVSLLAFQAFRCR